MIFNLEQIMGESFGVNIFIREAQLIWKIRPSHKLWKCEFIKWTRMASPCCTMLCTQLESHWLQHHQQVKDYTDVAKYVSSCEMAHKICPVQTVMVPRWCLLMASPDVFFQCQQRVDICSSRQGFSIQTRHKLSPNFRQSRWKKRQMQARYPPLLLCDNLELVCREKQRQADVITAFSSLYTNLRFAATVHISTHR